MQLAIDDFGTGYSSLNYVRQFPIDILKIDKSFVDGLAHESASSSLVATVLELARVLGLRAVAEGVEATDQLGHLQDLQCEFGQGFLFAKPLDPLGLRQILQARREGSPLPFDLQPATASPEGAGALSRSPRRHEIRPAGPKNPAAGAVPCSRPPLRTPIADHGPRRPRRVLPTQPS